MDRTMLDARFAGDQLVTIAVPITSPPLNFTISAIHVAVGDVVKPEQILVELDTDKATLDLTSHVDGVVQEILVSVGDAVEWRSPLIVLRVASETITS